MKRLLIVLISGLCIGLNSSCDKLLTEEPQTFISPETFYKTETQLNGAIWGCFEYLLSSKAYGDTFSYLSEVLSYSKSLASGYGYSYLMTTGDVNVNKVWTVFYQCIGAANSIISIIESNTIELSEDARDCFLGEVYFYRALSYFNLVRCFGDIPIVTKLASNIDELITPREPIKKVYESVIIPDLQKAIELLPLTNPYDKGRAHKISAAGILAKVYCTMAGFPLYDQSRWQDAKDLLLTIVNPSFPSKSLEPYENGLQGDMADLYYECSKMSRGSEPLVIEKMAVENGIESVFELNYSGNVNYNSTGYCNFPNTNAFTQYNNTSPWLYKTSAQPCSLGDTFPDYMFYFSDSDPRRYITFTTKEVDYTLGTSHIQIKVPKVYTSSVMSFENNWVVMRYAELVLLLAEAENEINGPTDLAISCVNAIRKRARNSTPRTLPPGQSFVKGQPYDVTPKQSADKDTFRHYIKKEVICELAFEGVFYFDFVRWHELEERLIWAREAVSNANSQTREWPGDYVYFWPIPLVQINATNNILTQNEGY